MPDLIELEVATPERELVRENVESAIVPGKGGYLGILPGHAPLVSELGTGFLTYSAGGRKRFISISKGFLEVLPDHIRVLADVAERAEEIDVERARAALKRAQEQIMNPALGVDPAVATAAEQRALARIAAAEQK